MDLGDASCIKTVANYVYLAVPKDIAEKIGTGSLFEERAGAGLGVGILAVNLENKQVEVRVEAKEIYIWRSELRDALVRMVKSQLGIKE
jgi:sRNA-binding carbon storage regulator CsrA